jgi:Ca-activated chloride channel family protein
MTFLAPAAFLLLVGVAGLAIAYVVLQRRRSKYAVRFTNVELLDVVAPERPSWRRHVPAALLLAGLGALTVALARPARDERVPTEQATVVVAVDTSLSMLAEDVSPNRIEAAKAAAMEFVQQLPPTLNVGLVDFNGVVRVRVSPTRERDSILAAIDGLQTDQGTAIGDALVTSVDLLANVPREDASGEVVPARIVLMSDGKTTVGRPDEEGIAAAVDMGIPVSTIAFGTDDATVTLGDSVTPVPIEREGLRAIADQTGGTFFEAGSAQDLRAVYADIGSAIGYETQQREVGWWFVGAAMALLTGAAVLSLLWFSRLP